MVYADFGVQYCASAHVSIFLPVICRLARRLRKISVTPL